jgi:hypothetical protein
MGRTEFLEIIRGDTHLKWVITISIIYRLGSSILSGTIYRYCFPVEPVSGWNVKIMIPMPEYIRLFGICKER